MEFLRIHFGGNLVPWMEEMREGQEGIETSLVRFLSNGFAWSFRAQQALLGCPQLPVKGHIQLACLGFG